VVSDTLTIWLNNVADAISKLQDVMLVLHCAFNL
jgi:hypothetical protein